MSETPEQALIRRMREQRMSWVTLNDATTPPKRVRIIRPTEVEVSEHLIKDGSLSIGHAEVVRFTVGWEGFTEADLLGPAIGGSDPLAYSPALWAELSADHAKWSGQVARALLDALVAHNQQLADNAKN